MHKDKIVSLASDDEIPSASIWITDIALLSIPTGGGNSENKKKLFLLHILALDVHWTRLRLLVRAGAFTRDSYFTPIMITGLSGMGM